MDIGTIAGALIIGLMNHFLILMPQEISYHHARGGIVIFAVALSPSAK
ncbi:hypothetical protein [Allomesorhizobium alhagi]|uniref:Uncharacterized protein n=1 Tax=Mesorhizobium alhagi CCNWXJ12-2 TaxID=1107882 RepID=H0HUG7_9HYPH|nr:hypothetical protein [Mesorhizobium alhagi]EHK55614.1 hypothetical protein MAXJ12_19043 [Mesorhizobium alhagi CCNWXJ12-2]